MTMKTSPIEWLRVHTDGSYDHRDKSGGWAFAAQYPDRVEYEYGKAPRGMQSSSSVELFAILRALEYALSRFYSRVLVFSDSRVAIGWAKGPVDRVSHLDYDVRTMVGSIRRMPLLISFRWVKGHQPKGSSLGETARLNREVDGLAKQGRAGTRGRYIQTLY